MKLFNIIIGTLFIFFFFSYTPTCANISQESGKNEVSQEIKKIEYIFDEIDIYIKNFDWEKWYLNRERDDQSIVIANIIEKYGYKENKYNVAIRAFAEEGSKEVRGIYVRVIIVGKIVKVSIVTEWWNKFKKKGIKKNVKSTGISTESYL
jgi:hypothetical protein